VPWTVSPEATKVTFDGEVLTSQAGDLLGSAEQAFIEWDLMNKVPSEKLVAVSPCFRMESEYNDLHHLSFMKVELYWNRCRWQDLLLDAKRFFESLGIENIQREIQPPGPYRIQEDLVANGIELGSYGYRTQKGLSWSYGTGLAEPRTSVVMKEGKNEASFCR